MFTNIEKMLDEQESLVEVRDVHLNYARPILRDITVKIPAGQTLVVLGESGCGKTQFLKSIIGLVKPTRGKVLFNDQDIGDLSDRQMSHLRLRFGYVFQNAALFDSMSIEQNVAFPLRQHGRFSSAQIHEMVVSRLWEVGLPEDTVYKYPAQLSGGERKRVGLARALVMNPELILYDEPTTGLDPIMSDVINELILRTRSRNPVTSVVVTHDMNTARKVGDRIIMLMPLANLDDDEPQVIFDGTPEELNQTNDRRVRQFVNGEAGERLIELRGARDEGNFPNPELN